MTASAVELIDTHCHLDWEPLAGSVDAVLARAKAAGVAGCLTVGTTVATSRRAVELARPHTNRVGVGASRFPAVRAAVGIHPNDAEAATDEAIAAIEALAQSPEVAAIGEVGLDYYRRSASPEAQRRALARFIRLAARRGLPLVLHCREAHEPLLELLRGQAAGPVRGVIHCASGPPAFIESALTLGLHISFAGNVTFPNAEPLRALVSLVPDDRLLLETDAPFLAPQPVRGRPNEPAHVAHTAAYLAQLRKTSVEALGALTSRNARHLFGFQGG